MAGTSLSLSLDQSIFRLQAEFGLLPPTRSARCHKKNLVIPIDR